MPSSMLQASPLPDCWNDYSRKLIMSDRNRALARLESGQRLSNRQWAAYLWERTGIPTAVFLERKNGSRYVSYDLDTMQDPTLIYYPAPYLADRNHQWCQHLGRSIFALLDLLNDPADRALATNYANGVYIATSANDPGGWLPVKGGRAQVPHESAAEVRRMVGQIVSGHKFPECPALWLDADQAERVRAAIEAEARLREMKLNDADPFEDEPATEEVAP